MNIMIFDTETIGKVNQDLLNIGYKIIDLNVQQATFKTLVQRDYLVNDLINNTIYCLNDDFVGAHKYGMYVALLEQKQIVKHSLAKIFDIMAKDIAKYKVLFGYAYNCNFDVDKFNKSAERYNLQNPLANLPVFDIWAYAKHFIIDTPEYKAWALDNKQLTQTQIYLSGTVESVVRYLTNNLDFKEDHTALSDTQHETNILVECVKRGCDITRPMEKGANVKSDLTLQEIIVVNGVEQVIEYKSKYVRNGKTTYKM